MTSAKRPWWQTTKTPKWGFFLGASWLSLALLRLLTSETPGRSMAWTVGLTVVSAVPGVIYLVTAELLRRRQRSAEDGSDPWTEAVSD